MGRTSRRREVSTRRASPAAPATGDPWRAAQRAALWAVCFLILLLYDERTKDTFWIPKYVVFLGGAMALLGLWAVRAAAGRAPRLGNGLHAPVLAFVATTGVATWFSTDRVVSVIGADRSYDGLLATVAGGVVFFAAAESFDRAKLVRTAFFLYAVVGGSVAALGLVQLPTHAARGAWLLGTLGNPNYVSGFLVTLLPLGVMLLLCQLPTWRSIAVRTTLVASMVEITYTVTRGAWVALFVSLATLGVVLWRRGQHKLLASFNVVVVFLVVPALSFLLFTSVHPDFTFTEKLAVKAQASSAGRLEAWKSGVTMVQRRPLTGFGPDTFPVVIFRHQTPSLAKATARTGERWREPHNVFVNVAYSRGVPGLLAFLALLALFARRVLRGAGPEPGDVDDRGRNRAALVRRRDERLVALGLMVGVLGYVVQGSFNIEVPSLQFTFWFMLGLGVAATAPDGGDPGRASLPAGAAARPARTAAVVAVAGGVLAVGAPLLWLLSGLYRADVAYDTGQRYVYAVVQNRGSQSREAEEEHYRDAALQYKKAMQANPWSVSYRVEYASIQLALSRFGPDSASDDRAQRRYLDEAIRAYRPVIHRDIDPYVLYRYAQILQVRDQLEPHGRRFGQEALRVLERVVRDTPYEPRYRRELHDYRAALRGCPGAC